MKLTKFRVTLFAFLLAIPAVSLAFAGPPISGGGDYTTARTVLDTRTADGTTFIDEHWEMTFNGTIVGVLSANVSFVIQDFGQMAFHGDGTFNGTIAGNVGQVSVLVVGTGTQDVSISGMFVFGQGSEGLAGIHGHGDLDGTVDAGTYTTMLTLP